MKRGQGTDFSSYLTALPLYARNLGVALPPLIAALVQIGLLFLAGPLTDPVGGIGAGIFGLIAEVVFGFAFAVSLIFADNAWRFERASIAGAWSDARRKAGNILLAVFGTFFLLYVAQYIGAIFGGYGSEAFGALAVFFIIYAIPAAAIGGVYGPEVFSRSIRIARAQPLATAVLAIVSVAVLFAGLRLPVLLGPYVGFGYYALQLLCPSLAIGYVALVVAKQYGDNAFGRYW